MSYCAKCRSLSFAASFGPQHSALSNQGAAPLVSARIWRSSSWIAIGFLGSFAYSGPALADCSPAAANNVIATCTGTTTTQYGTGAETDVTITVSPGASLAVSTSTNTDAYSIYVASVTAYNYGSVTAASSGSNFVYGILGNGSFAIVTNSGTIAATNTGSGAAFGITGNTSATVINSGSITATIGSGSAFGIYGDRSFATVTNSGSITASGSSLAYGIYGYTSATVTNSGSITATSGSSAAVGIVSDSSFATVTNSGSITATSGSGGAFGIFAFRSATVTNSGTITATSGSSVAYGIVSPAGSATVINFGTIAASNTGAGNAYGIVGGSASTLVNTGTISAVSGSGSAYALGFGNQADSVTLGAGSKLIGTLSLGGGADAISFIGGNHNLTFETGNLTSAVLTGSTIPYAVSGDRAAAIDPTSFAANTTMLQSTTRVISSLAPDFTPARNSAKALPVLSYAPGPAALKLPEGAMAHVADAPLKSQTAVSADGTAIWTRFFGGQSYDKADGVLVGFRNSYYGGAIGIDRPVDANLRYGAFLGGLSSTSKLALNYGDTDSRMGFVGAYARYAFGASFVKVGLQAGYGSNDTTRRTNNNLLASGIETATSNSSTWYVSPEISFGHEFALGRFLNGDVSVTPTGQLRYLFGSVGRYSETGGTDNLRMDGHASQSVEERLTFKLSHVSTLTSDYQLKLDVIGGVLGSQRVSGDTLTGNLLGQSIRFSEPGKASRKAATAGMGAEVSRGLASFFVAGEYIAQPNGAFDYSGRVGANIRF